MNDILLSLGQNAQARRLIKSLGLPIPIPEKLRRARGPWEERPLHDQTIVIGSAGRGRIIPAIASTIPRAGAEPVVVGEAHDLVPFEEPGEAYGRRPLLMSPGTEPGDMRAHGLVFDATDLHDPEDLRTLYDFFHPWISTLARSGRVIVCGRPPDAQKNPGEAAVNAALEGFVRSMAKEVGRRGATAQLLLVHDGAEDRVPPVLRFLLSARSAFVTGQKICISDSVATRETDRTQRPLDGKIALVTGAARGIGEATAALMAQEGAHVVCLDRPADDGPLSQVARRIGGTPLLIDLTDPEAPELIVRELKDRFGGLDILVHNAGVTRDKTIARMNEEQWDSAVDVNLGAVVRITRALVADGLRDQGRIVCLSSVAGIAGNMGQTNYAASKAGIIGYVRALAAELEDRGIAVNAVAPGFIETRLTAAMPIGIREAARRLSALGQGGEPEDVGNVICFLASPGAAGITGSVLRVCGGALVGA